VSAGVSGGGAVGSGAAAGGDAGASGVPGGGPPRLPPGRSPQPQRPELTTVGSRTLIFVCHGPSCSERGSQEMCRTLRDRIAAAPPSMRRLLRVCETTCLDSCATGPNVVLGHDSRLRTGLLPGDVERFLDFVAGGAAVSSAPPASLSASGASRGLPAGSPAGTSPRIPKGP